jgi:hypothetical protein
LGQPEALHPAIGKLVLVAATLSMEFRVPVMRGCATVQIEL